MSKEELKAIEKLTDAVKELDYTLTTFGLLKAAEIIKDFDPENIEKATHFYKMVWTNVKAYNGVEDEK